MNDLKTFKLICIFAVIFTCGFKLNVLGFVTVGAIVMSMSTPFILYAIYLTIMDIFEEFYDE